MLRFWCVEVLEPLNGHDFRPAIRVAMPWANDPLLLGDANISHTADVVLDHIAEVRARAGLKALDVHKCNGIHNCSKETSGRGACCNSPDLCTLQ